MVWRRETIDQWDDNVEGCDDSEESPKNTLEQIIVLKIESSHEKEVFNFRPADNMWNLTQVRSFTT